MPRPPLKQVALLAGVSEPTASRVMNGRSGVAEPTRTRVVEALRTLGYDEIPDPIERRRGVIGLVCGEFLNPIFASFAHHISTEFGKRGLHTTISVTDPDLAPEARCIKVLKDDGVDAIVFVGGQHSTVDGDYSHYRELAETTMRLVFVNGADTGIASPHVRCDEGAGAIKALNYLLDLGHTRLGCVLGSDEYVPTARFREAFHEVMERAGLPHPDEAIAEVPFTVEGGQAAAKRLLAQGVTAVICGNDLMALGAISAARQLSAPLAVVGYDGTDLARFSDPPLTTLRQPVEEMAALIAEAVVSELAGSEQYRDQFVFEPQLVVRDSTATPR